ncbi:GerAB/ArcD/ProY family transporter [Paucisalibacillus globulus]|uniref:GerAB/ArcD/ProY family transporter n=1 Tax=Paucisalibacillus globulus TaxID=351095 RepID=UPI000BB71129|nr:endospore germination permease [Paucisalibacillus globulus]
MRSFKYGDEKISGRELMIALPSIVISVDILSLPKEISNDMNGSDGWIVLLVAGGFSLLIIWMMARLAASFPGQSFLSYASTILSKPVAIVLTLIFGVLFIGVAAYYIRVLGQTSQQYLFEQTPVEVVSLSFLLVIVYAVCGSRAALFRLNMLFFPIINIVLLFVLVINIKWVDVTNLLPVFQTDLKSYVKGLQTSVMAYMGFSIVLFYIAFVDKPKKAPKLAMLGMLIPIVLFILVYLFCLMIFGHAATSNLLFPTIDLAKRIEVPGGILERVEAFFFIVWTMGVFNGTTLAFDAAILALNSVLKRMKKVKLVIILSPIIYYIALLPRNISQINMFQDFIHMFLVSFAFSITIILVFAAKIRGVGRNDKANK